MLPNNVIDLLFDQVISMTVTFDADVFDMVSALMQRELCLLNGDDLIILGSNRHGVNRFWDLDVTHPPNHFRFGTELPDSFRK